MRSPRWCGIGHDACVRGRVRAVSVLLVLCVAACQSSAKPVTGSSTTTQPRSGDHTANVPRAVGAVAGDGSGRVDGREVRARVLPHRQSDEPNDQTAWLPIRNLRVWSASGSKPRRTLDRNCRDVMRPRRHLVPARRVRSVSWPRFPDRNAESSLPSGGLCSGGEISGWHEGAAGIDDPGLSHQTTSSLPICASVHAVVIALAEHVDPQSLPSGGNSTPLLDFRHGRRDCYESAASGRIAPGDAARSGRLDRDRRRRRCAHVRVRATERRHRGRRDHRQPVPDRLDHEAVHHDAGHATRRRGPRRARRSGRATRAGVCVAVR